MFSSLIGGDLSIGYVEDLGTFVRAHDRAEVLPISVGDKDLTKLRALNEFDYSFYALRVKLVEYIVQQQDRLGFVFG